MPNNMKWGKRPYKHGGHIVPGMFQGNNHTLPKAQSGNFGAKFPHQMYGPDNPNYVAPPEKRNWWGRMGNRIANVFRSDKNDRSIQYKNQYMHPELGMVERGNALQERFMNQLGPQMRQRGRSFHGQGIRKRGGSIGPNGTL